jgi:hypothetical protein
VLFAKWRTAEIIPVEPEQGNACAGKVFKNILHFSPSQHSFLFINDSKNLERIFMYPAALPLLNIVAIADLFISFLPVKEKK